MVIKRINKMSKVEDFLTKAEEQEIVEAIGKAEKDTSGEIRVHIEKETSRWRIPKNVTALSFMWQ